MRTFITLLIIVGLGVAAYFLFNRPEPKSYGYITTFQQCATAGFPIMESYPEQCRTPDGRVFTNTAAVPEPGTTTGKENLIVVTTPTPNQEITSPVTISGRARGNWYFEASFPIEVLDANGKQLGIAPAQAQGEWMTEEFVPFSLTLPFTKPTTETGTIVLHKDNASGEPQFDDELRIPVRFKTAEKTVRLYYYNKAADKDASGNILCSSKGLVTVSRTIPSSQTPIQDTIRLLLKGELTAAEKAHGITTEFPLSGVTLTGASQNGTTLTLSFKDPLHKTSGGSCRVAVLWAQISATAKQFSGIEQVRFLPEELFQP
ncbi:MAG TPA: Gmad2 immunoglobulin-like domain-containing protein [Candidatus Paceibacterota bacterium]|nr:Gmad2 immunoglobulin-like domain-containing protein [Candidatus Paceibacterota bacterium]